MRIKSGTIVYHVTGDTVFSNIVMFLEAIGKKKSANMIVCAFAQGKSEVDIGV